MRIGVDCANAGIAAAAAAATAKPAKTMLVRRFMIVSLTGWFLKPMPALLADASSAHR
jgi:hypothetical protein